MSISVLAVVLPNATAVLMLLIAPFRKRGPTDTRYFETTAAAYLWFQVGTLVNAQELCATAFTVR